MTNTANRELADEIDERAVRDVEAARQALRDDQLSAIVLALLALEARIEELTVHIARR
jgi:hypothetical protein